MHVDESKPSDIADDFLARTKKQDVARWFVNQFVLGVASRLPAGAYVLDAGAGECFYKKFFAHCEYRSIDLAVGESRWNYSKLDYVGPLHEMPIEDEKFDAVLCTEVLEHLEWPRESVKEMCRVLKPGGKLNITVPMSHREHQVPYDFFRYTSYGLKSICTHAGFRHVEVTPFGGLWVRWAYELPRSLSFFPSARKFNIAGILLLPVKLVTRVLIRLLQSLFLWLDQFDRKKDDPFGWSCVATK